MKKYEKAMRVTQRVMRTTKSRDVFERMLLRAQIFEEALCLLEEREAEEKEAEG